MGTSKNWERYNLRNRVRESLNRSDTDRKPKEVFEVLEYYILNQEKLAKNWVVVPPEWRSMSDDNLFKFCAFHRREKCAKEHTKFSRSGHDRLARVSDDVIEMLNIRLCKKCDSNFN